MVGDVGGEDGEVVARVVVRELGEVTRMVGLAGGAEVTMMAGNEVGE